MNRKYKLAAGLMMAGGLLASPLHAQFFDTSAPSSPAEEQSRQTVPAAQAQPQYTSQQQQYTAAQQAAAQQQYIAAQQAAMQGGEQPVVNQPNVQAGGGHKIAFSSKDKKQDQELIMMYMKDFSVYRSPSGQTRCSMQFAIVTTLPEKLSNISYRLQWPGMETVLSFSNVAPEVENHFNYSLLGDGCYSMDKSPNIIINRCRVKGLSQRACAAKVRWITRAS